MEVADHVLRMDDDNWQARLLGDDN